VRARVPERPISGMCGRSAASCLARADGSGFAAENVRGVLSGQLLEEPPVQFGGACIDRAGQVCVDLEVLALVR
jgi:hypothetical protein